MAQHTRSAEHNTTNESTVPQAINVMGMEVDRAWFTGLLETLPQDQQRQLSRLLLQTITEVFPDLTGEMGITHPERCRDSPVTDEFSDNEDELGDEDDGQENNEDENDGEDDNDGEEGAGAEDNEEDGNGEDELYRNEEGDEDDDENEGEENEPGASDDAGIRTYRLNAGSDSEAAGRQPKHRHVRSAFSQQGVTSRNSSNVSQVPHHRLYDRTERGQMSGYLARFNSPRIRRGLTIWEELSVTIPSFMKDYVMDFASDAGMLVHPAGAKKGGLVTVHVLFHLAQHRRPVCRLLDLVLEAEDGILSEQDFKTGGAFTTGEAAIEDDGDATPEEGAIDYDCFDSSASTGTRRQGSNRHITAHDIAMYGNIKAVRQFVRPATRRD